MFASKDVFLTPPATGGYIIGKSVRFRSSATAYLNRTPASAGNRQTWTLSAWIKRGVLSSPMVFFGAGSVGNEFAFNLRGFDAFDYYDQTSSTNNAAMTTNAVYRDPSAWYHIVFAWDTTQATSTNRWKFYVNGVQITSFSATQYPTQNYQGYVNSTVAHYIGVRAASSTPFDGYLTEINFIDGQALTPSSFGSTNALTGVWQPAKYTGTYGTNGFYLNFSSNGTSAALGTDFSGNSNTWTVNNISVTAGATYDSMTDVPTLTSATAANYCVMNPLALTSTTLTNGNLTATKTATANINCTGTIAVQSGKYYWECAVTTQSSIGNIEIGIAKATVGNNAWSLSNIVIWGDANPNTAYRYGTNLGTFGASIAQGDLLGVALDMDGGTVSLYINGTLKNTISSVDTTVPHVPFWNSYANGDSGNLNFGQRPFSYTPPTGYVALNTYNLPTSTITNGAAYMAATTYTGTGASLAVSNAVSGTSFQPDFVWIKDRSNARNNSLLNSITGTSNILFSDLTNAEQTGTPYLTSFNSNGFTAGPTYANVNGSGETYVGWQWKAGTTSSSNTNGSITSTVSVGATQGFSVVTYTGTGANATVGHGLGVAPNMIIVKERSAVRGWPVYHSSLTSATYYVDLQTTQAQTSGATIWNSTAPTSSVFSIGTDTGTNQSTGTYVAYCFAAVKGFSAFGSYTGNGSSDGPFVYLGFRPRFIMVKRTDTTGDWWIWDSARNTFNVMTYYLAPNRSDAEFTANTIDFLSNGFKFRDSSSGWNASGGTYIYMAFAENPFRNSLAR